MDLCNTHPPVFLNTTTVTHFSMSTCLLRSIFRCLDRNSIFLYLPTLILCHFPPCVVQSTQSRSFFETKVCLLSLHSLHLPIPFHSPFQSEHTKKAGSGSETKDTRQYPSTPLRHIFLLCKPFSPQYYKEGYGGAEMERPPRNPMPAVRSRWFGGVYPTRPCCFVQTELNMHLRHHRINRRGPILAHDDIQNVKQHN